MKVPPPGCGLPKVRKPKSIRAVPDARTLEGKIASQIDPDPQRVALSTRARHAGLQDTRQGRKAAAVSYMGFAEGLAIHAIHGDKGSARLWNVWQGLCGAKDGYARHYIGSRRRFSAMRMQMIRERVETEDFKRDTRTADEKSRDASNRWMTWQGYLDQLDATDTSILRRAYWEELPPLWEHAQGVVQGPNPEHAHGKDVQINVGRVTESGWKFVRALEALAEASEEQRTPVRGIQVQAPLTTQP